MAPNTTALARIALVAGTVLAGEPVAPFVEEFPEGSWEDTHPTGWTLTPTTEIPGAAMARAATGRAAWSQLLRAGEQLDPVQQSIFLKPRPREQLFHLGDDPMETRNLANRPEHQETLELLRGVMDRWSRATGDTVPPPERRTPDGHDRETGKRLYPGFHPGPGKYEVPGQSSGATSINHPGPR